MSEEVYTTYSCGKCFQQHLSNYVIREGNLYLYCEKCHTNNAFTLEKHHQKMLIKCHRWGCKKKPAYIVPQFKGLCLNHAAEDVISQVTSETKLIDTRDKIITGLKLMGGGILVALPSIFVIFLRGRPLFAWNATLSEIFVTCLAIFSVPFFIGGVINTLFSASLARSQTEKAKTILEWMKLSTDEALLKRLLTKTDDSENALTKDDAVKTLTWAGIPPGTFIEEPISTIVKNRLKLFSSLST